MYTIAQAARLTGVTTATLRAWERRYGLVSPQRTEAGYRIYDEPAVAAVSAMRSLVDAGWGPAQAARAVREGSAPTADEEVDQPAAELPRDGASDAAAYTETFLAAARHMDTDAMEESLDRGFALGSFERVVDSWLFPALRALGDGWARGEVDVGGEHAASHAVHRRLSAAFDAAGSRSRGPKVVVGLPSGSRHELGALAFATALRRQGHDVLYLGADVPADSWQEAVRTHHATAAILPVVMTTDRRNAIAVARRLQTADSELLVASGGAAGTDLEPSVITLPARITTAAHRLDELLRDHNAP
jgi:DNA-binding transcriptional MerR regulator/methylmalonyl-CoA mutase cobalamin-binding subunit